GQPYLVMEYVEGKPIDIYAETLTIDQKLRLFLKVCAAVSYLHRNLVVHRDLKPPNILVTGEGEPKLLDFGIAKMLDLSSDATVTGMRMLTPDYASPEQAAGMPVTTATDVYSLGVVLYKLLTGTTPHRFDNGSIEGAAARIAEGKITSPASLVPALKGDLEFIICKALRKNPQERYATVDQFADDLENYLESRPIRARKADTWYRARKFIRRYWLPIAAATLAIAGLSAGLALANRERIIAQRRFKDVQEMANRLLEIDFRVRDLVGGTQTRQLIADTSLEYLRRLAADVRGDPDLALQVGNAYMRVARVQGVPVTSNLGQMEQAEKNLLVARQFIQTALAARHVDRLALLRSAQIEHDLMLIARLTGRGDEALRLARQSGEALDKYHAVASDKPEATGILTTYLNVSDQLMLSRQYDDALQLCTRAADVSRALGSRTYLGTFLWVSAEVYRRRGDLNRALADIRESVRQLDMGPAHSEQPIKMNFIFALVREGNILGEENAISLGRRKEAIQAYDQAYRLADSLVHLDSHDQGTRGRLAIAGLPLAELLRESDPLRSLEIYDHVVSHMSEIQDNSSFRRFEVSALAGSTYALRRLGRSSDAQKRLDAVEDRLRALKSYPREKIKPGSDMDEVLTARADAEAANNNLYGAIGIYNELLAKVSRWGARPESDLSDAVEFSRLLGVLARLQRGAHHPDLAGPLEQRRLELWQHWDSKLPHNDFVRNQLRRSGDR
ncbi:MAG TPA: serine/threonine-protein kinase, partial [Bryobacteraceae bacterium]